MKLIVEQRTVYGRALFYPVNEAAKTVAVLVKQKTLDETTLTLCKKLGLEIEVRSETAVF